MSLNPTISTRHDAMSVLKAKFSLLAEGLTISERAWCGLIGTKGPLRTRSGISGGLDLAFPYDIHVNAPVRELFAQSSKWILDYESNGFYLSHGTQRLWDVTPQPEPDYYRLRRQMVAMK